MQAVVFDLDGVLTNTAKFHFEAWSRLVGTRKIGSHLTG